MSESVEVAAEVEVAPEAAEKEVTELAAEAVEVEEVKVEADVEAEIVETEVAEVEVEEEPKDVEFSASEFSKIVDEFGADVAAQTVKENGDYSSALKLHADGLAAENETLTARIVELEAHSKGTPAKVGGVAKKSVSLFKSTK